MKIVRSVYALKEHLMKVRSRASRPSIGFVPTMGALHEGHSSLIRRAKKENHYTVVSIFVNPLQFGPNEDYADYPRHLNHDIRICRKESVDLLFIPRGRELIDLKIVKKGLVPKRLKSPLCGACRPGHFDGVVAIVKFFFKLIIPDRAYFGQKDFQQWRIIDEVAYQIKYHDVQIVLCPTIRDKDGLAMSSRNQYLKPRERRQALKIYQALKLGRRMLLRSSQKVSGAINAMAHRLNGSTHVQIEYLSVVDVKTLKKVVKSSLAGKGRLLIALAVRIGQTRLIDNIFV